MRFLKVLVIVMAVVIVMATTVLIVLIGRRLGSGTAAGPMVATPVLLDEPSDTQIVAIAAVGDRLAVSCGGAVRTGFCCLIHIAVPWWDGSGCAASLEVMGSLP